MVSNWEKEIGERIAARAALEAAKDYPGSCPFHGVECYYECGSDRAIAERAAGSEVRHQKDTLLRHRIEQSKRGND